MLRKTAATNENDRFDALYLSSNHKVMQYLQESTHHPSKVNGNNATLINHYKTSANAPDLFYVKHTMMKHDPTEYLQRLRANSDNSSTIISDSSSRFDCSCGSSASDPGIFSSDTSSSGIYSTSSDFGHEAKNSNPSGDLDFNLTFDQVNDNNNNDNIEVSALDEADENDECDRTGDRSQQSSNRNSADTSTLLDVDDSNVDTRIKDLEELLHKSASSTTLDCYGDLNNDEMTMDSPTKPHNISMSNDSTYSLYSQDRFSAYVENDDHEDIDTQNAVGIRSNSLGSNMLNRKSIPIMEKPPKKVVRFADTLGLDLESIRYMTPPDQSVNFLLQDCIRIKFEQLRFAKAQSNAISLSSSPFDLSNTINSALLYSLPNVSRSTNQYYFISKNFASPSKIIPLIYERKVILECLYTKDAIAYGTVRVHNFTYEKRVFARKTENDWKTFKDIYASHSMTYPQDNTDTFMFEIHLERNSSNANVPKEIQFAICLQANNQEFWDNNSGSNFILTIFHRR